MPASAAPLKKALADYQLAVLTGLHTGQPASNLGSVATGKALSQALGTTTAFRSKSWSLRGSLIYAVLTATITGPTATIEGCLADSTVAFTSGLPVNPPRTTYVAYSGDLVLRGNTWIVSNLANTVQPRCPV